MRATWLQDTPSLPFPVFSSTSPPAIYLNMSSLTYVCSVEGLQPEHAYMYSHEAQAVISECSQRGLLGVDPSRQLQNFADVSDALEHVSRRWLTYAL